MKFNQVQTTLRAFDQGYVALIAPQAIRQLPLRQACPEPGFSDRLHDDLVGAGEDRLRHWRPAIILGAEQLYDVCTYDDFPYIVGCRDGATSIPAIARRYLHAIGELLGEFARGQKMKRWGVVCTVVGLTLSACASPLVTPNPPSFQVKAEHLHDWQAMAQRAVAKMPSTTHNERPTVYVDPGSPNMPFAVAYKKYLEQALYEADYPVMTSPSGAQITLHYDVQWFYYGNGNEKPITNYATLYGVAALVMGQTRNISRVDTALGVGAASGLVIDFLASMNDITRAEVVMTTNISSNGRYHYLGSENFYVQPRDLVFYIGGTGHTGSPESLDMRLVSLPVSAGR